MARRDKKTRLIEPDMMNAPFALPDAKAGDASGDRGATLRQFAPGAQGGKDRGPRRQRSRRRADAVHGDTAQKLGIKVGGFLRQDFAGSGDFHDLLDGTRTQKKTDLSAPGVDGVESGPRFAFVSEMGFRGNRLRRDAQSGLEDSFVKQDDVKFALERRDTRKKLGQVRAVTEREEV